MTKTGWLVLVIIIVVVAGGLLWWNSASAPSANQNAATNVPVTPQPTPPIPTETSSSTPTSGAPMTATVTYDGNSFSPTEVTVAKGGTVTFTDTVSNMWVASDPHPVHNGYDGTSRSTHCAAGYSGAAPFDQCKSSSSFTFTFNKVGSWSYHDHFNDSAHGTVTVVAAQ
jgi:plastocyanin